MKEGREEGGVVEREERKVDKVGSRWESRRTADGAINSSVGLSAL